MSNDINKLKQRLEIRKYLVFAGMFLLFLGAMWFIFAPSEEDKQKEEKNAGFNTELPDPRGADIEEDKIAAYEQADINRWHFWKSPTSSQPNTCRVMAAKG